MYNVVLFEYSEFLFIYRERADKGSLTILTLSVMRGIVTKRLERSVNRLVDHSTNERQTDHEA